MEVWRESKLVGSIGASLPASLSMTQSIIVICLILYVIAWCGYLTYKYNDKTGKYFGLSPRKKIENIFYIDGYLHLLTFGLSFALAVFYGLCEFNFFLCFIWSLITVCEITHYCYFGRPK